jgi:hypothetical protein
MFFRAQKNYFILDPKKGKNSTKKPEAILKRDTTFQDYIFTKKLLT